MSDKYTKVGPCDTAQADPGPEMAGPRSKSTRKAGGGVLAEAVEVIADVPAAGAALEVMSAGGSLIPLGSDALQIPGGLGRSPHPLQGIAQGAALDPARLAAATEKAARALLRQGEATNTRMAYASAMRYWCAWYAARYGQTLQLPLPVAVVVQFIVDHAQRMAESAENADGPVDAEGAAPGEGEELLEEEGADREAGDPAAKPSASRRKPFPERTGKRSGLITELPEAIDAALVEQGYKAKVGALSLATINHRIAVMSKAHQMAQAGQDQGNHFMAGQGDSVRAAQAALRNPCADPLVRELLARTRRAYAQRGYRQHQQRAITKDPLQRMLATCDDSLKGKRDRALLLFAWSTGGRRRSEVASATLDRLQRADGLQGVASSSFETPPAPGSAGPGGQGAGTSADTQDAPTVAYLYTLGISKTNQRGDMRPEDVKPVVGIAAVAMQAWLLELAKADIKDGEIFRRIRRGGHIGEPLAAAAVRDIVKERAVAAGLGEDFSAHSLRAGFVTEAGRQNAPLAETMALTGHQSVASVLGYFRGESTVRLTQIYPGKKA